MSRLQFSRLAGAVTETGTGVIWTAAESFPRVCPVVRHTVCAVVATIYPKQFISFFDRQGTLQGGARRRLDGATLAAPIIVYNDQRFFGIVSLCNFGRLSSR